MDSSCASVVCPEGMFYTFDHFQQTNWNNNIRSAKQDDNYGASNTILPCHGSWVIFHLVKDVVIIFKSSI
jgi:hypothetical protein